MRRIIGLYLLAASLAVAGCGGGSPNPAGPTATSAGQKATAGLTNRFLFDHNAAFNDGRTFRWVPPIPIFIGDDGLLLEQFLAWESALAGAGGTPFYSPQGPARRVPRQGIFFSIDDLPGNVVGFGCPFFGTPDGPCPAMTRSLAQVAVRGATRRTEMPEVLASGEIRRCSIVLDANLASFGETAVKSVIRHEIGHCLGFIGHVPSGLMKSTCCALNITSDVSTMMRALYNNPPGTEVSR
jgi:hypothetical protein